MIRIGLLGSGFVAEFYMQALSQVPGQEVIANYSRTMERAEEFGRRWGIAHHYSRMEDLVDQEQIDLLLIALPNHLHLPAVRLAAQASLDMVCTKPLGRNASEAGEMVGLARSAGVMAGYAETEVFAPSVMKARELIEQGVIGRVLTVRSREAHSGPHAPHFWNTELSGGGCLMDMGCHTVEAARYFLGKHIRPVAAVAWGTTLVHKERTRGEDNAVMLVRFEDDSLLVSDTSWTLKGGMVLRNEIYGTAGQVITDSRQTNISAFTVEHAGYLQEKADSDTGWVFPIPDEARVYGYHEEMCHFVECKAAGLSPRETFEDGYVVAGVIDAAYRSMSSGHWENITIDPELAVHR
jgi:predicted dehydrogenase